MIQIAVRWSKIEVLPCFYATLDSVEILDGIQQICGCEGAVRRFR